MKPNHAFRYVAAAVFVSLISSSAFAEEILVDLPNFGNESTTQTTSTTPANPTANPTANPPTQPTTVTSTDTETTKTPEKKSEPATKPAPKTTAKKPTAPPPPPPPPRPKAPVEEQQSVRWQVNDRALYNAYEGTIVAIYGNNTARLVYDDGSSAIYDLARLVRIVNSMSGWRVNDRALRNNNEGTVTRIYGNGSAKLVYDDGSSSIYTLSSLVHIVSSANGWSTGQKAMRNNYEGTIVRIYDNGTAHFIFNDGSGGVYSLSSLVRIAQSLNGWTVNERAMLNNSEGTITAIYSNGTAQFVFDDGSSGIYDLSRLTRIVTSLDGWSVGARAMKNNYEGTITKMYANGTVGFVFDDGSSGFYRTSDFVRIVKSLNGWSVGERAMKNNYEGTITKMYANGTVGFVFDDGSSGFYRTSDFVRIVRSLNGWSVGQRALVNNYEGTITKMYANGTVGFVFDDGSSTFTNLSRLIRIR